MGNMVVSLVGTPPVGARIPPVPAPLPAPGTKCYASYVHPSEGLRVRTDRQGVGYTDCQSVQFGVSRTGHRLPI